MHHVIYIYLIKTFKNKTFKDLFACYALYCMMVWRLQGWRDNTGKLTDNPWHYILRFFKENSFLAFFCSYCDP